MNSAILRQVFLSFHGAADFRVQWLDFPRVGNNNSFHYARRQWNVVDDDLLRYKYLNNFDRAMNMTAAKYKWLSAGQVLPALEPYSASLTVIITGLRLTQTRSR
jgi:1,4-alpha-glucan branching enzyme